MLNIVTLIGIGGALLLAASWVPQIIEVVRLKKSNLNQKFAEFMWLGSLMLLIYSLLIRDVVFVAVNIFILSQISISLYYEFFVEKHKKRKEVRKK